ncbi:uncharacterized protein LOC127245593 [Andrographis paniculata]|uniref:uncharacterized protein LOC127245593 n=1 Tax=Andrographis paniculata TaxID=175694 RepID=UPI0021E6E22E|nr:uncharacterized protein LOC127245593 [Andrographis paniculata]XP_051122537.1 uncharacterized protein LOC127245593 [Andrographis paniculata]
METMMRFCGSSPLFSKLPSLSFRSSIWVPKPNRNYTFPETCRRRTPIFVGGGNPKFSTISASNDRSGNLEDSSVQRGESFFRTVLASMETVYLNRNPTAKAILDLVGKSAGGERICYDHFAFRTFGVHGHGIESMAKIFLDFGYVRREELRFPAKKLRAFWYSPPSTGSVSGDGVNGPLPRIFISELLVDHLSPQAQSIIKKYTQMSGKGSMHAALASALGCLTWETPSYPEFETLARESEYAAWTLVNGYALNHVTISAHRLKSSLRNIQSLNEFIEENGFKLNSEGSVLKVSPDGLLLQSSTVADSSSFRFADGVAESIPRCYIEFAERLVLPQFRHLPENEVEEFHRRDGFEVGNADKIFESTSKDQLSRNVA